MAIFAPGCRKMAVLADTQETDRTRTMADECSGHCLPPDMTFMVWVMGLARAGIPTLKDIYL